MLQKLLFFSFLFSTLTFSQNKEKYTYDFIGVLTLEDNSLYSYQIEFNIYGDKVKGYSYTDLKGPNETKSKINGIYNKKTKKISFKESEILYTKSDAESEIFCFINIEGTLKLKSKKTILKGKLVGLYNDNEPCAKGEITLIGLDYAYKKMNKIYKKIKKKKKIDSVVKEKINPNKVLKKQNETTITSGETVSVFVYKENLKMEIWDYGKEDGDKISLYVHNKILFDSLLVTKKKKKLNLKLNKGSNIIKIATVNAGSLPTNTAKIILYDYERTYEVLVNLKVGESTKINIVRN